MKIVRNKLLACRGVTAKGVEAKGVQTLGIESKRLYIT